MKKSPKDNINKKDSGKFDEALKKISKMMNKLTKNCICSSCKSKIRDDSEIIWDMNWKAKSPRTFSITTKCSNCRNVNKDIFKI